MRSLILRVSGLIVCFEIAAGCAPRPTFPVTTMPSPEGCFVQVWDGVAFAGTADYINGPRRYANMSRMPGDRVWQHRIRSAKVGPTATITAWSDENFRGGILRLMPGMSYPALPDAMSAQIESIAVECTKRAAIQ